MLKSLKKTWLRFKNWIYSILAVLGIITLYATGAGVADEITPATYIQVKIGSTGTYEDGDIIDIHNSNETLFKQAEQVTHPNKMPRKANGNLEEGNLLQDFYEESYQYKFERISANEVRRTKRFNDVPTEAGVTYEPVNEVSIISNIPNAKGEVLHVDDFVRKNQIIVFGETGSEYWYGGVIKTDNATVNNVWDNIETKSPEKRNPVWQFSDTEKKHSAIIKVADMTANEVQELMKPLIDTDGKLTKKRAYKIDMSKTGLTPEESLDLTNKTKTHDFTNKNLDINIIKVQKSLPVVSELIP